MNCEEFRATYLAGETGEVSARHLEGCAACRSHVPHLDAARAALDDPSLWEEPSPELAGQVEGLIRSGAQGMVHRSWRRWGAAVGVAAALVVGVGLYAVLRPPAPDWEVGIPGTELAPQAAGIVSGWNTDSGTRMILDVEGLERAPAGFVYEFWLTEGELHISAGTFTAGGEVELRAGVRRADFPRLWVTLEPLDDDESPSSYTVLDTGP